MGGRQDWREWNEQAGKHQAKLTFLVWVPAERLVADSRLSRDAITEPDTQQDDTQEVESLEEHKIV